MLVKLLYVSIPRINSFTSIIAYTSTDVSNNAAGNTHTSPPHNTASDNPRNTDSASPATDTASAGRSDLSADKTLSDTR